MLVLSRRPNEKIVFPSLNVAVEVVSIKPGVVRLGIEAPEEIAVFREELANRVLTAQPARRQGSDPTAKPPLRELKHLIRNRLHVANIGLALLRRQVQQGLTHEAEATIDMIEQDFRLLQQRVEQEAKKPTPVPPGKQRKALVVEDDANECKLLAGFLRMAGLEVVTAGDGADALDYLRTQSQPDFVLLDMLLPRCDGPTTIRAIRGNPSYAGLKVFALTGHSPDYFGIDPKASGIDRWFQKPVDPETLLHDVTQELDGRGL